MTSKQEQLKEYYFKKQKLEKELSELKINLRKAKIKVYDLENNVILKFIYNDFKLKKEKQEMMRLQTQMNTREEELKLLNDKIEYLNNYKEKEHIQNFELEEKLNNLFLKQKEIKKSLKKYKNGLTLCKDAKDYIQEAYFHASAAIDPRLGVFPIIWKNEALDKAQESLSLVKEYIKDVDIQLVDPLLQAIQGKYDSLEIKSNQGFDQQEYTRILSVRKEIEKIIEISKKRMDDLEKELLSLIQEEKILREEMNNL